MLQNRIRHLEKEHERLDKTIDALEKTGVYTDNRINHLKRERLLIRDELAQLRKQEYDDNQRLDLDEEH